MDFNTKQIILNKLMQTTAEKMELMPVGLNEFEFDVVNGEKASVIGLHYWTGKSGKPRRKMKHHFKKIENNYLLIILIFQIYI